MKSMAVVMTTRRPEPVGFEYLRDGLPMLWQEGAVECDELHVVVDGPLKFRSLTRWEFHPSEFRQGSRSCLWRALHLAAALRPDVVYLFEDDARPRKNAVRRMLATTVPTDRRVGIVSYFDGRELPDDDVATVPFGLHPRPACGTHRRGLWGALALAIPIGVVDFLAARSPSEHYPSMANQGDRALGEVLDRSPWPSVAYHAPTLFDHCGDVSAVGNAPGRRGRCLLPEGGDALELPPATLIETHWLPGRPPPGLLP